MKTYTMIVLAALCLASALQAERLLEGSPHPEIVMQRVLKEYGIETEVVKPYRSMKEKPDNHSGGFLLELYGGVPIRITLNEDYWALATVGPITSYMLNPRDEQSALNISIGEGLFSQSDEDLRKAHGFSAIERIEGQVSNKPVTWRRWSDANHLYSDCTVYLPVQGISEPVTNRVDITITANTEKRRLSLQQALNTLQLLQKEDLKQTTKDSAE
ncbi:MAG: hypothetical protein ACSHYA_17105 [Opitutaceae bacterium]